MTTLLIIFIWTGVRWEFSNIEPINDPFNSMLYCQHLAGEANSKDVHAFCVPDEGEEA